MPIRVSLYWDELKKLDPSKMYQSKKGPILDLKLVETKGDKYGNDYFATIELKGEKKNPDGSWIKTPILGNAKVMGQGQQRQEQPAEGESMAEMRARQERQQRQSQSNPPVADDSVPF